MMRRNGYVTFIACYALGLGAGVISTVVLLNQTLQGNDKTFGVEVTPSVIDLGVLHEAESVLRDITLKAGGDKGISITGISASCGCTAVLDFSPGIIPLDGMRIPVTYTAPFGTQDISHHLELNFASEGESHVIKVPIRGKVKDRGDIRIMPAKALFSRSAEGYHAEVYFSGPSRLLESMPEVVAFRDDSIELQADLDFDMADRSYVKRTISIEGNSERSGKLKMFFSDGQGASVAYFEIPYSMKGD